MILVFVLLVICIIGGIISYRIDCAAKDNSWAKRLDSINTRNNNSRYCRK